MGKKKDKQKQAAHNPDIDVLKLVEGMGNFITWLKQVLFAMLRFFVSRAKTVLFLILVGLGLAVVIPKWISRYEHKIIVSANFNSADYLYSKIDFLEHKIEEQDSSFLKSIGIQNPSAVVSIKIEPIVDLNNLMNSNVKNTELLQLMAQNGDLKSLLKETNTQGNFDFHRIILETKGLVSHKNSILPLLNYLNASEYYKTYQRINSKNLSYSILEKQKTISQIDSLLRQFSPLYGKKATGDKLVYYNENLNLDQMIQTRDSLVTQINKLKVQQYNSSSAIRERGIVLNSQDKNSLMNNLSYMLPLLFMAIFVMHHIVVSFYRKEAAKAKLKQHAQI